MTIAFGSLGTVVAGTTSLVIAYPTVISAGDLLIVFVCNKYATAPPKTISGFTLIASERGGHGANGVDAGVATMSVYTRTATGPESGSLTLSIPSGNSAIARMAVYTKTNPGDWSVNFASGAQNTPGTAWSVTAGRDPGIKSGDTVLAASAINIDTIRGGFQTMTATGATFAAGVERIDQGTTNGDDCSFIVSGHAVTAGEATAPPVFTMTMLSETADGPCGATVFLRLREPSVSGARGLRTGMGIRL